MELPKPYKDCIVKYRKHSEGRTIIKTKRGFWDGESFAIPPSYRYWNGHLTPHGWGGDYPSKKDVINWKYCED
tara:strand:- start:67 stop:285 length:219 start_codon:yes stop_codon:yes gene_type:complete